jgi:ligand-binding SRPBCC domain-containing protein
MSHVRNSVHIEAPPAIAWQVGRDPDRIPQWNTTAVAVKDVTGPLDRVGTRLTIESRVVGRSVDITWEVQEVESPRYFVATATTPMGGSARQRVDYEPEDGGTKVTVDMEYELAAGLLGKLLNKAFAERMLERDVVHSGENFKALVEEEARVPAT